MREFQGEILKVMILVYERAKDLLLVVSWNSNNHSRSDRAEWIMS